MRRYANLATVALIACAVVGGIVALLWVAWSALPMAVRHVVVVGVMWAVVITLAELWVIGMVARGVRAERQKDGAL